MKKRAAVMIVVSVLICVMVVLLAPRPAPQPVQETGSGEEAPVVMQLVPDTETVVYEQPQTIGVERLTGLQETLTAASDYGEILPYPAKIAGWTEDGTPVYRYALVDSAGEFVTEASYTSVSREMCDDSLVWLLTSETEDGETAVSCAAQDGSWVLGPFSGSITVEEDRIFVQRSSDNTVTIVYDGNGKILGQIAGTVSSYADDVIVSSVKGDSGTVWYLYHADTLEQLASLEAVSVGTFSGGSATVQLAEGEWGFVDANGIVTETDAVWMDDSFSGYALARDADGMYGVLDDAGNEVVEMKYIDGVLCSQEQPVYQLWEDEETCIVISVSRRQKLALPNDLEAQRLTALPNSFFAYTGEDGNTIVFDDLVTTELEGAAEFYEQGTNTVIAVLEDGYQLVNTNEGQAGKVHEYRYVVPSEEASLQDSVFTIADMDTGLQGIANINGRTVLEPAYDSIYSVDGSYFAAVQGSWSGIVDSNGDWIVRTRLAGAS